MKIEIEIDDTLEDFCVVIKSPKLTPEIEKMISMIRLFDMQIVVSRDEETYMLDCADIMYIEAVDRSTFIYTKDNTYESTLKLYEFENQLSERGFIRISKSMLMNLKKVKSLRADLNRKIRVTLQNGEQIMVSRSYADELRKRLGLK